MQNMKFLYEYILSILTQVHLNANIKFNQENSVTQWDKCIRSIGRSTINDYLYSPKN